MSNSENKNTDKLKGLIESGSDIAGSVAGSVLGTIIGGIPGAIIGGAYGPIVTRFFADMGKEVSSRFLSPREEVRIGATLAYTIKKIQDRIDAGEEIRDDGFFDAKNGERADAVEILEGVLLIAQKSYEEKKVKLLGNLYANIAFDKTIDKEWANYYLRLADSLSFRQLCLLALYSDREKYKLDETAFDLLDDNAKKEKDQIDQMLLSSKSMKISRNDTIWEIDDLETKKLIQTRTMSLGGRKGKLPVSLFGLTEFGVEFCRNIGINDLDIDDIMTIRSHFIIS